MRKRVILISGGTSGIGLAAARMFLESGDLVMLAGRSAERGRQALQELQEYGGQVQFTAADVSKVAACQSLAAAAAEHFGRIDVLVNSAGIYLEKGLTEMTEELFDELFAVNVKGTYFLTQAVLPYLRQQEKSNIVNVSSDAGLKGNYFCSAYCASKGAVTLFTKSLALELAAWGIRVNCICPGDILTPMTEKQLAAGLSREEALREMPSVYPLGRIGRAEEAAALIHFLASDKAGFVTGAAWSVDGGITA